MNKLEIMAKSLGMEVGDVIEAVQEAAKTKPRKMSCYDQNVRSIIDHFDWSANKNEWKWNTATDALILAGMKNPTRSNSRSFGCVLNESKEVRRRRSNGKTLLLLPPIIDNRD